MSTWDTLKKLGGQVAGVRCRFCKNVIKQESSPYGPIWMTPIGERTPPGVALPIECPARRVGETTTFGRHAPR